MATNLAINDRLVVSAKNAGHHRTKKAAVTEALVEYVRRHRQLKVAMVFGKIDYDPTYSYKRQRQRA